MEASPKWSSYVQFAVQAIILIMLAVLLGYIYIQDDRLKELEKRMATMSIKAESTELVISKTVKTFLKLSELLSEGLKVINVRLGIVGKKMTELFIQPQEFASVKDQTSKELKDIEAKSQLMKQEFRKMEDNLENIREELENTDQMFQQLKDRLADVCNRDKSAVSLQQILQSQLDEIATEIATIDKTFNQRDSDLKNLTEKNVEMKSVQSNAIYNVDKTNKDIYEPIGSRKDVLDKNSNAFEIEKGNFANVKQHSTASDSCQTGVVALDQPISSDDERLLKVQFGIPFSSPPVISYGIVKLDTNTLSGSRVGVSLKDQSTTGFTASFTTWLGSIVYECAISWVACARS
ncbi:hypothetical protein ACJMK2_016072 [Sinanodonta woodiana]|uniref:H-type lectin domain-containing protein n=1 Tax=Sinanodonta woodiana TaxID=1069815 RepID=A0ABD3UVK1_SINWO